MTEEIRDLDDVEAQAWAMAYSSGARWAEGYPNRPPLYADECIRLLRARRAPAEAKITRMGAEWLADVAAERERAAIVAYLRRFDSLASVADAIKRGEHER